MKVGHMHEILLHGWRSVAQNNEFYEAQNSLNHPNDLQLLSVVSHVYVQWLLRTRHHQ